MLRAPHVNLVNITRAVLSKDRGQLVTLSGSIYHNSSSTVVAETQKDLHNMSLWTDPTAVLHPIHPHTVLYSTIWERMNPCAVLQV